MSKHQKGDRIGDDKRRQLGQRVIDAGRFIVHDIVVHTDEAEVPDPQHPGKSAPNASTVILVDKNGNEAHVGGLLARRILDSEEPRPDELEPVA